MFPTHEIMLHDQKLSKSATRARRKRKQRKQRILLTQSKVVAAAAQTAVATTKTKTTTKTTTKIIKRSRRQRQQQKYYQHDNRQHAPLSECYAAVAKKFKPLNNFQENVSNNIINDLQPYALQLDILQRLFATKTLALLCHKSSVRDTHQIAAAQQEKNARLREAFNIKDSFVSGSSFLTENAKEEKLKVMALQKAFEAQRKDLINTTAAMLTGAVANNGSSSSTATAKTSKRSNDTEREHKSDKKKKRKRQRSR